MRLPNGEEATREVVDHVDGAAVLALDEANRVLVVRQYRYVFGKVLDELPAGKLDPGEDPVTGALRELKEETGAEPETFLPLGKLLPAPGCYGETLHLFLAKGLKFSSSSWTPMNFSMWSGYHLMKWCTAASTVRSMTPRPWPQSCGPRSC